MKKTTLLLVTLLCLAGINAKAQTSLEKAEQYLDSKKEVYFDFKIEDVSELQEFTDKLSILNYDPSTKTVYAWANTQQFNLFLERNLSFNVNAVDNEAYGIVMSNQVNSVNSTEGSYPLTFPLTYYPTYADYEAQMYAFATMHPDICELVDIGGTTEGVGGGDKRLLFIKLSDNIATEEAEPKLMYTSSMHGDEITGYPLMLDLIDYFITAYKTPSHPDNARITSLINNSEIWINPMANPDGTYYNSASNTSVVNSRRANANNVDLNRNYPDNVAGAHPDGEEYQIETQHFLALAEDNHFVLSANFHGGTEVVNYPFDNTHTDHADSDWFFLVSKEYAVNCQNNSPSGYMDATYSNYQWPGVTEGADWYQVYGGRQDYMNFYKQCKEVTIELSNTKVIPASQLDDHWDYNREALIEYLIQGTYGFQGFVKDAVSNNPVEATVTLVGHDAVGSHTVSSAPFGDYYRPVKSGTYDILFEAPCYQSFTLTNQTISDYQTLVLSDILLTPLTASAPTGLTTTGTDSSSTNASWTASTADDFDIRYRVVGASSWIEVTSVTNPYQISGLDPETTYEFQVRSYCGSNNTSYSTSQQFSTTGVNYCDAEGGDIGDEYISNVTLNSSSNNTQSTTSSGYSDLTSTVFTLDLNSSGNNISVTKYWTGTQYREAVSVWIDFNHNGTFESSEKIMESASSTTTPVSTTFSVPNAPDAKLGTTRMRVIMKYYNSAGNTADDPCETFNYGEVEDYTIDIIDSTLNTDTFNENNVLIYPNPFNSNISIKLNNINTNINLNVYDVSGRSVLDLRDLTPTNNEINLTNLNSLSSGTYFLKITDSETNTSFVKRLVKQ